MTIWAIVPVKPLRLGKSRLAGTISEDDRINLNTRLLEHTLRTLANLAEIGQVLVVSRDSNVLAISRELGAKTILENGSPHLNTALTRATVFAQLHSIHGVLILPADLPLITRNDILSLIKLAENPPVVVISPDRREEGTNALLISPAGLIDYDFGPNSFERHCQRAKLAAARLEIVNLPSLAFDLDIPEDLQMLDDLYDIVK
ncbi:MAG: 2-phospho-L-lactate guanylyltransferase [Chloroflexi bacterium GWB2_49_20]|nr:MAG: 2-phospho-L-lactate guanylyltransferase [Chloroflexi bacterium GWB2_49_20]OGN78895.1 MAG: 2-phospho-L-lactate guanylyltransferase [Chloroflexi bacterium GWC2_49_37]OGN86344.1 MAG: 2-phospho-L-lactate guanylyltransferase [Chloroflexi bacterium GWD2_49_16]HBG74576.1 2-phospho-L-lactate guanylyltransferase [Anaerolineae bacterium]